MNNLTDQPTTSYYAAFLANETDLRADRWTEVLVTKVRGGGPTLSEEPTGTTYAGWRAMDAGLSTKNLALARERYA